VGHADARVAVETVRAHILTFCCDLEIMASSKGNIVSQDVSTGTVGPKFTHNGKTGCFFTLTELLKMIIQTLLILHEYQPPTS